MMLIDYHRCSQAPRQCTSELSAMCPVPWASDAKYPTPRLKKSISNSWSIKRESRSTEDSQRAEDESYRITTVLCGKKYKNLSFHDSGALFTSFCHHMKKFFTLWSQWFCANKIQRLFKTQPGFQQHFKTWKIGKSYFENFQEPGATIKLINYINSSQYMLYAKYPTPSMHNLYIENKGPHPQNFPLSFLTSS